MRSSRKPTITWVGGVEVCDEPVALEGQESCLWDAKDAGRAEIKNIPNTRMWKWDGNDQYPWEVCPFHHAELLYAKLKDDDIMAG